MNFHSWSKTIQINLLCGVITLALTACGGGSDGGSNTALCVDTATGLVSWWPGDGDATDIAGSNHGTLQGGATFAQGTVEQAFDFNGTDAYVSANDDDSLDGFTGITVDAWIRTSNSSDQKAVISKYHHSSGSELDDSYYLGIHSGKVRWQINAGNSFSIIDGTADFADGDWHHVAGTWDGTTDQQVFYVDGELNGSMTYDGGSSGTINITTEPVIIAGAISNSVLERFFEGQIDEVRVYDRALDASEIQTIFAAGSEGNCKP